MAKNSTKKTGAPAAEFVGKAEFEAFKDSNDKFQSSVLDMLEKMTAKGPSTKGEAAGPAPKAEKAADPFSNGFLPPQYQKIFDKYFDSNDGFTARLVFPEVDEKNNETGGITFTIFVPLKFSNTDDGYRKMYKQDLRTRALQPHNIAKGIEDWCKAVANNLKYDRNVKTK